MIALDTNILARFLLKDDPEQYQAAVALFSRSKIYTAPLTVILELVWVLQVNDCSRNEILKALRLLFGLPNFKPKEFEVLCYALRYYEQGLDFGDALHLASSAEDDSFVTFDKSLVKQAKKIGIALGVTEAG